MRIFITGGTGFIGKNLLNNLKDHEVTYLVRKGSVNGVETITGNVENLSVLPNCDAVIHLAGILGSNGSKEELWKVHVKGTQKLIRLCKDQRFIHISSAGVLGPCKNADENAPLNPTNDYEKSKAEAEKIVRKYNNHVILRPEFVYGPYDNHVLQLFKSIKQRQFRVIGTGMNKLHPTYVDDLVQCILQALDKNIRNETFNIAGDRTLSVREFTSVIAHSLDTKLNRLSIPKVFARIYVKMTNALGISSILTQSRLDFFTKTRTFNTDKARKILGYQPMRLDEGIRRTIEWYKIKDLL